MSLIASAYLVSGEGHRQDIQVGPHALVADEAPAFGGHGAGPSPWGYVLAGLAACTSITLRMYAKRKRWELGRVRVDLRLVEEADRRRIERLLRFEGPLSDEQRARLLEIADKTPVTKSLRAGLEIETRLGT